MSPCVHHQLQQHSSLQHQLHTKQVTIQATTTEDPTASNKTTSTCEILDLTIIEST